MPRVMPCVSMVLLALGLLGCDEGGTEPKAVVSLEVSPPSGSIQVGQTLQLTATAKDAKGRVLTDRTISWSSSNASAATVSQGGLVAGEGVGGATITAASEGRMGSASVTVTPVPVASVEVSPASGSIHVGETLQLMATAKDAGGNVLAGRAMDWSSSDVSVATVSQGGLVTGVGAGDATITATSEGRTGSASVTVTPVPVASVELSPTSGSIQVGETLQLTATAKDPAGNVLDDREITWSSSNTSVATVSQGGLVTGVSAGSATITAVADTAHGSMTVTVEVAGIAPSLGFWHAPTEFGGFYVRVEQWTTDLEIAQLLWAFHDWRCGGVTWNFAEGTRGSIDDVADGRFQWNESFGTSASGYLAGTFDAPDHFLGSWRIGCSSETKNGTWEGGPASPVYPQYDEDEGLLYLTSNPPPEGTYWTAQLSHGGVLEWSGKLDGPIGDPIYMFPFWLGCGSEGDPACDFHITVLLEDGTGETELATTSLSVVYSQQYRLFASAVEGQTGGKAGDRLILRIEFDGPNSEPGDILFGDRGTGFDSLILLERGVTVGRPAAGAAVLDVEAGALDIRTCTVAAGLDRVRRPPH